MSNFLYTTGVFAGQSKWFALSTPLRFAISCVYLFLFVGLSWAILYYESEYYGYRHFPMPPEFHIPFLGSPYEWARDSRIGATWAGLIALILTWGGVVKIAARNQFGHYSPVATRAISKTKAPVIVDHQSTSDDKKLFYKNCETAFESACKYGGHDLQIGSALIAIVLDARKEAGSNEAVKTLANGRQLALLKVSSADGGFVVMSETPSAAGPKLNVGDLVSWHIGAYSKEAAELYGDPRAGWVGLIVATVKLEYSIKQGWQLDAIFAPESMD